MRQTSRKKSAAKKESNLTKQQKLLLNIMSVVCLAGLVFAVVMLAVNGAQESDDRKRVESDYNIFINPSSASSTESDPYEGVEFPVGILDQMKSFYARNSDTVGFLMIDGIDGFGYPVVQGNDNDEYYRTNLDMNYSREGTAFVDYRVNLESETKNLIIHGHNNKNGLMFGPLDGYNCLMKGLSQYKKAPLITYYTLYEKQVYKIVGVVVANTKWVDGPTFEYVVPDFANESDFDLYKYEIDRRSVIDTGVEWEYGDNIMVLHTCVYYWSGGNARLLIVARQLRENEADVVDTSTAVVRTDAICPDAFVDKTGKGVKASSVAK